MQRAKRLLGMLWFVLTVGALLIAPGQAQIAPNVVQRGKLATALVEVGNGKAYGSAFCIHASGLFVTNAHVVDAAGDDAACSLVLHPGESDQQKLTARVVRVDKQADLALLQVDSKVALPSLELSDSDTLLETQEVVVFGFPFGKDLATGNEAFPSVTVTTGHITALRKIEGVLAGVQMDAAIHPGNSGGPVLNTKGQVVGVVVAHFAKAEGINLAIPVNHLHALLHKTEVIFNPPSIPLDRQHEKQDFVIQVATFEPSPAPYQVELSLTIEDGPSRTYTAQTADGRTFHVVAVPVPAADSPAKAPLRLTFQDDNNEIVCHVKERSFQVGGKEVHLSQLQEIRFLPTPAVTFADGKVLEGAITGLGDAEAEVAGSKVALHLDRASRIAVENRTGVVPMVAYHIVVRRQQQVVAESNGSLPLASIAAVHPPSAVPLQGAPPLRFEAAHTYKVPAAGDIVLAADLDGDHCPDVVIGDSKQIGVLYGHRDGTLEPYQQILTWQAGIGSRELVDLNGDGRPDLVFLDGQGKLVILYNRGGRKFSEPVTQSIDCGGALYVGDINRDGRPDIVVGIPGSGGSGAVKILLNNGDGTFREQSHFGHIGIVEGVTAKDINGDGIPDLAVSFETSTGGQSGVSIYYGDGNGNFHEGPTYNIGTGNMNCPTLVDLNGDGKPDLLVCNYWGGNVAVFLNKGDGTFLPPTRYPVGSYPIMLRVADFNRDGKPDFVVPSAGTSHVTLYRNRGNGQFEDPVVLETGGGDCRSVFVADFNRDGKPDLVTQNQANATIGLLINRTGE